MPALTTKTPANCRRVPIYRARAVRSLQERRPEELRRMLNDAESEQALHLLEFRAVLMTYALCLCPHIFSFFTHTSCSFLDLETNERCEVTNTLLQLTYQFVCLFHRQLT